LDALKSALLNAESRYMGANTAMWKVFAGYTEAPVSCATRVCLPKESIEKKRKKIYFFMLSITQLTANLLN